MHIGIATRYKAVLIILLLNKICVHILFYVHAYKDLTLSQMLLTYVYKTCKFGKILINDSCIMQENFT